MRTIKTILFLVALLVAGSISAHAEGQLDQLSGTLDKAGETIQGTNDIIRGTTGQTGGGPVIYTSVPSTRGRLTITGLGNYNGKYLIAPGGRDSSGEAFTAFSGVSGEGIELGEIRGGRVTLNVWKIVEGTSNHSLGSYAGNGEATFAFSIYDKRILNEADARNPANVKAAGTVQVTFTNGVATGAGTLFSGIN